MPPKKPCEILGVGFVYFGKMVFLEIFNTDLVLLVIFPLYVVIRGQYFITFGQHVVIIWLRPRKSSHGGSTDRVTQANKIDMAT